MFLFTATIALLSLQAGNRPLWVDTALQRTARPKERTHLDRPSPSIGVKLGPSRIERNNPTVMGNQLPLGEDFYRELKDCESLSRRVMELIRRGQYEKAYQAAEKFSEWHLGSLDGYAREIVSTALLTGRYKEAETLMSSHLSSPGHDFSPNYVQRSIAAAMQGKIYEGQGAYAFDALRTAFANTGSREIPYANKAAPSTPRDVALVSILAAAFQSGAPYSTAYLEWAMRLDLRNEFAAKRLVDEYERSHENDKAARLAETMVKALAAGPTRDGFALRLRAIRLKSDPSPIHARTEG